MLALLLAKIAVLLALLVGVFTLVLGLHIQRGNRMFPHIKDGDLLLTYKLEGYRPGDVVVYRHPQTGQSQVSRIVALGKNEIQVTENGALLINGSAPAEQVFYITAPAEGSDVGYPYQVQEQECFLLDDFRTEGQDSRTFGAVREDDLLGKVVFVFRRRGI